jgi:hypothetical protein
MKLPMAKRAQYVRRPCKTLDSPALWDWLESEHPELMAQFVIVFGREIREYHWEMPSQYPELREHIKKFVKCK